MCPIDTSGATARAFEALLLLEANFLVPKIFQREKLTPRENDYLPRSLSENEAFPKVRTEYLYLSVRFFSEQIDLPSACMHVCMYVFNRRDKKLYTQRAAQPQRARAKAEASAEPSRLPSSKKG